jgi:hypothetical protein
MPGHVLRDFEFASVLEVGGDAGGAEAARADPGPQTCGFCSPLNHHVNVGLGQVSAAGQPAMAQGREEWASGSEPSSETASQSSRYWSRLW